MARRSRRPRLRTRAKVALVGVASAFALAVVAAAGTSFWDLLTSQITGGAEASAVVPGQAGAGSGDPTTPTSGVTAQATLAPPSVATPDATAVRFIRPYTSTGLRVGYSVVELGGAECWETQLSSDPEALRCAAGDQVFDPCWRNLDWTKAVCLRDPWDNDVVTLTIETLETVGPVDPDTRPWGLELAVEGEGVGAVLCILVGGAGETVAGMRVNYSCEQDGTDAGQVVGEPEENATSPWLVYYSSPSSPEVVRVPVRTVWK